MLLVALIWLVALVTLFVVWILTPSFRADLPRLYGHNPGIPVEVPWFGAIGGLVASLGGIVYHSGRDWDRSYDYWHVLKPALGALTGSVSCLLLVVLLRAGTGNAKITTDPTTFDAIAFVFGYAEGAFRELIKAITDIFLKPGAKPTPSAKDGGHKPQSEDEETEKKASAPTTRGGTSERSYDMTASPRKIKRYGWQHDLPDHRDRIYNLEESILRPAQFPVKFSLRNEMPPVYDQGELGSCTANAIAAVLEHQEMKEGEPPTTPSRLFVYYGEREIEGTTGQDAGAQIRDGIKVVATIGAPPEEPDWPYDIAKFTDRPPEKAYQDAKLDLAIKYQRVIPGGYGAPIRTAVQAHHPIVFGFSVPESFESPKWKPKEQPLSLPSANEQFIGGHAVAIVGWDFSKQAFPVDVVEIRNSWGAEWGDEGYFWMDAGWFAPTSGLTSDFWVISQVA